MGRYRTIVADPPWDHSDGTGRASVSDPQGGPSIDYAAPRPGLPYETMNVREIRALPVPDLATDDACLYLWTTNRYLPDAFRIAAAWDFDSAKALVWCKAPKAPFLGGAFGGASVEFCLYAKRPRHREIGRAGRQWFQWPRGEHSAKPEAFLDIVEQVSPGPYLEMFARRARFGWDYWGDQSLGTAELVA